MLLKVKEITSVIESFAPLWDQESYDNSGLQTGDREKEVNAVLLCMDVTKEVLDEAERIGAGLVISHHPVIFEGLKKLTGANLPERIIIQAIRKDIAIYSAHTNVDVAWKGVSFRIAEKLGLKNVRVLSATEGKLRKLAFFVPEKMAPAVRTAVFKAGAGHIGEYDMCSFNTSGKGTFRGSDNTDPYVGEKGKMHTEPELKVEMVYPVHLENRIVRALLEAHPYEEVAYDIYSLGNAHERTGMGSVGEFEKPLDEKAFLDLLKQCFSLPVIRHSAFTGRKISCVGVCGGSGSQLLNRAISSGAEAFLTGDIKYHPFFDADGKILMADIGHYESERFTMEIFYDLLTENFSNFAVHLTEVNTNPVNYY